MQINVIVTTNHMNIDNKHTHMNKQIKEHTTLQTHTLTPIL